MAASVLGGAALSGCQYYWSKSSGTQDMFSHDSGECARQSAANPTAAAHGIVDEQAYRVCLRSRGWARDKQPNPPPPGWFRGIE